MSERASRPISRRAALVGGIGGAGILTLAACGSAGGSTGDAGGKPATIGSGVGGTGSLAALDSIPIGEAVSAQLDGRPVLVSRPTSTTAQCFSAICTHQGCTVAPAGKQLECPCHGSTYNALTGAVLSGPAPRALDKIPVQVEGGQVVPG